MTVAHRLTHGHNIGDHVVPLVCPHVFAGAPETRLHFVGNVHATGIAYIGDGCFHESRWDVQQTLVGIVRTNQQPRQLDAVGGKPVYGSFDFVRIRLGEGCAL